MKDVKEIILEKIKHLHAPPFLFVGSGLSQRYIGAPTWIKLLEIFAKIATSDELAYEMYYDEAKRSNCTNGIEPKIAELIERDFNKKWFRSDEFKDSREKFKELVVAKKCSPLKIEIAEFFKELSRSEFKKDMIHELELLNKVGDRSIAGVITTNYDDIIERIFENYKYTKYIGQEELIFSPITGVSEIYKIHGCCTSPNSIVLNDYDYERFNERNAYLVAKLLTIFLEHPIVFIGYKIGDANIREILTAISKCLSSENLDKLRERLIFIEWNNECKKDSVSTYEFSNLEDGKSISMTKICINDFSILYEALLENKVTYNPRLIKKLKEDIYNVVLQSEPSKTLKVLVDIDDDKLEDIEAVVGFGVMQQLGYTGYDTIPSKDLFEDVMFNNKEYINKYIVEMSLPLLLKFDQSIPIYKYIRDYDGKLPEKVENYANRRNTYSDFLSKKENKNRKRDNTIKKSIKQVTEESGLMQSLKLITQIDEEYVIVSELELYIKDILKEYPNILSGDTCAEKTQLRKLIRIYDFLKYKKKA